jgi:hypothetical protein
MPIADEASAGESEKPALLRDQGAPERVARRHNAQRPPSNGKLGPNWPGIVGVTGGF